MLKEIFNFKSLKTHDRAFLLGVIFMIFGNILYSLEIAIGVNFAIIRYLLLGISYYGYLKFLFGSKKQVSLLSILLMLWTFIMMAMSITEIVKGENNYLLVKKILSGDLLYYILPLFSLCIFSIELLRKIFAIAFLLAFLGVFFVPLSSFIYQNFRIGDDLAYGYENLSRIFTASGVIVFLTFNYHRTRVNLIVLISILISLSIFIFTARRNMIIYYFAVLFFATIVLMTSRMIRRSNRIAGGSVILIIFSVLLFVVFEYRDIFEFTINRIESGFDSREGITDQFIYDFNTRPIDWYIGRGVFGTFKTSILATDVRFGLRDGIENGYLTHILRGGIVYLSLLLLMSFKALNRGLRKNANNLTKAFGFIICIYFIDMIGFGIPENQIKFLIVWIAISCCNNRNFWAMKDSNLKAEIGL